MSMGWRRWRLLRNISGIGEAVQGSQQVVEFARNRPAGLATPRRLATCPTG
jgi:hypothetical protein